MDVEKLVDEDHCVRAIWELTGRLDLRRYHEQIAAVEGIAGREHTDPRLLISLWLYAYSRGISSARELARQCEYEPGCQWLCGLQPVSHRTLSGFRSENKAGLDDLFAQVLGMLSAEGLITLERVTLDGTKIKANASGNTFRGREKIAAHLEAARKQVRLLNEEAENEERLAPRRAAARAVRQRTSRLEAAWREASPAPTKAGMIEAGEVNEGEGTYPAWKLHYVMSVVYSGATSVLHWVRPSEQGVYNEKSFGLAGRNSGCLYYGLCDLVFYGAAYDYV